MCKLLLLLLLLQGPGSKPGRPVQSGKLRDAAGRSGTFFRVSRKKKFFFTVGT